MNSPTKSVLGNTKPSSADPKHWPAPTKPTTSAKPELKLEPRTKLYLSQEDIALGIMEPAVAV